MLHLKFLLYCLVVLSATCGLLGYTKPLTKEEFDNSYARYLGDLQECKEDKVCKDKVNSGFIPVVDEALESGLEVTCESGKSQSKLIKGKVDRGLTCSARSPAPTSPNFNFYKKNF